DQPELPQRGGVDAAQPRVHDAGVLPGLRRLHRPDAAHRDDVRRAGADAPGPPEPDVGRARGRPHPALSAPGVLHGLSEVLGVTVTPETDAATLTRAAAGRGLDVAGADEVAIWKAAFDGLLEPTLVQPTFITDFPIELSPLARRKRDNPRLVDRFELYVGRRELANAYSELNDPI